MANRKFTQEFKDSTVQLALNSEASVLKIGADLLKDGSRETDTVSRWGGEEFLIVVENITKDSIILLAEKLRTTIETNKFYKVNHKTASFGVAVYNENDTITTLISRVDKALYEAKNAGRNRVVFA